MGDKWQKKKEKKGERKRHIYLYLSNQPRSELQLNDSCRWWFHVTDAAGIHYAGKDLVISPLLWNPFHSFPERCSNYFTRPPPPPQPILALEAQDEKKKKKCLSCILQPWVSIRLQKLCVKILRFRADDRPLHPPWNVSLLLLLSITLGCGG